MNADRLLAHYERIADTPEAIPRLRRFIHDLAVRGKLVDQHPQDEPASDLLKRIAKKKARMVKAGTIKLRKTTAREREKPLNLSVPTGWELTELGVISEKITDGAHKTPTYVEDGIPFVSVKDFSRGILDLSSTRFIPPREHKVLYQRCDPRRGDILIARIGTLGKAVLVDTDIEFSLFVSVGLVRFDHQSANPEFLRFVLNSPFVESEFDRIKIGGGTHTNKLNLGDLHTVALPLPPIAEQRRIVSKVDELMALCDQLEAARTKRETTRNRLAAANLARLNAPDPDSATFQNHAAFALENLTPLATRPDQINALRQTILSLAVRGKIVAQNFTDEPASTLLERLLESKGPSRRRIEDISKPYGLPTTWTWAALDKLITTGPQNGISPKPTTQTAAPKAITLTATTSGTFKPNNFKHVEAKVSDDSELWLRDGDLLFQRGNTREYVGIAAIYEGPSRTFLFPDLMMRVRVSPLVNLRFVHLAAISPPARAYFFENASGAQTTMPKINQTILVSLPIPLPPLAEQHRIVAKVDEMMALCDRLEESLSTGGDIRRRLLDAILHDALEPDTVSKAAA